MARLSSRSLIFLSVYPPVRVSGSYMTCFSGYACIEVLLESIMRIIILFSISLAVKEERSIFIEQECLKSIFGNQFYYH